eukprot:TRINITY_DN10160_c0_g1_i1.p1 TRINITY_DN10160_c0_g1~~TRINITY_DN10160_c0_g1_i1.p1  ORF type:complete len:1237 (+),score=257.61 TRINITY_DN10160_c0_g1_i1:154-3864(+)
MDTEEEFTLATLRLTSTTRAVLGVLCLVITISIARIFFRKRFLRVIPEAGLVILLGMAGGGIFLATHLYSSPVLNISGEFFFVFLIPPILLEAGYFLEKDYFFANFGTISVYAVIGTLVTTLGMGLSLYLVSLAGVFKNVLTIYDYLILASIITATDPVAVLSIFEELHVDETLSAVVFGESTLNDGVSIVLFGLMSSLKHLSPTTNVGLIPVLGMLKFVIVGVGGLAVGTVLALVCSLLTRFTVDVPVVEPVFFLGFAFLSYTVADMFGLSGTMSVLFCGIVMSRYVQNNINPKIHVTIKYLLKTLASLSETLIFMFLGISFSYALGNAATPGMWDISLLLFTVVFWGVWRLASTLALTYFVNKRRAVPISIPHQLVHAYAGQPGAIAFVMSPVSGVPVFVSTTLSMVLFCVFILGNTVKPLLKRLHIRMAQPRRTVPERVLPKSTHYILEAMEVISGVHERSDRLKRFWTATDGFLQRMFLRKLLPEEVELQQTLLKVRKAEQSENAEVRRGAAQRRRRIPQLAAQPKVNMRRVLASAESPVSEDDGSQAQTPEVSPALPRKSSMPRVGLMRRSFDSTDSFGALAVDQMLAEQAEPNVPAPGLRRHNSIDSLVGFGQQQSQPASATLTRRNSIEAQPLPPRLPRRGSVMSGLSELLDDKQQQCDFYDTHYQQQSQNMYQQQHHQQPQHVYHISGAGVWDSNDSPPLAEFMHSQHVRFPAGAEVAKSRSKSSQRPPAAQPVLPPSRSSGQRNRQQFRPYFNSSADLHRGVTHVSLHRRPPSRVSASPRYDRTYSPLIPLPDTLDRSVAEHLEHVLNDEEIDVPPEVRVVPYYEFAPSSESSATTECHTTATGSRTTTSTESDRLMQQARLNAYAVIGTPDRSSSTRRLPEGYHPQGGGKLKAGLFRPIQLVESPEPLRAASRSPPSLSEEDEEPIELPITAPAPGQLLRATTSLMPPDVTGLMGTATNGGAADLLLSPKAAAATAMPSANTSRTGSGSHSSGLGGSPKPVPMIVVHRAVPIITTTPASDPSSPFDAAVSPVQWSPRSPVSPTSPLGPSPLWQVQQQYNAHAQQFTGVQFSAPSSVFSTPVVPMGPVTGYPPISPMPPTHPPTSASSGHYVMPQHPRRRTHHVTANAFGSANSQRSSGSQRSHATTDSEFAMSEASNQSTDSFTMNVTALPSAVPTAPSTAPSSPSQIAHLLAHVQMLGSSLTTVMRVRSSPQHRDMNGRDDSNGS